MTKKILTPAQKKANARNALFRQIHGCSLSHFADIAYNDKAITFEEYVLIKQIQVRLNNLKLNYFDCSKLVGLNPKRRCHLCSNVAHWSNGEQLFCNKHKDIWEKHSKENFVKINPNE